MQRSRRIITCQDKKKCRFKLIPSECVYYYESIFPEQVEEVFEVEEKQSEDLIGNCYKKNKSDLLEKNACKYDDYREKQKTLIQQRLPPLTKLQVFKHYQTFTENLLQNVLVDGFRVAFYELFTLIQEDNEYRKNLDSKSDVLKEKPLEEEYEKLELIAHYLKEAETANNISDFALLYKCHFNLAKQFTAPHEKRLSDHFYEICLKDVEQHECDSDGRARAESNLYVGLAAETEGDLDKAYKHIQLYYLLAKENPNLLVDERISDKTMISEAGPHLVRICTKIAERKHGKSALECIEFYQQAHDIAIEDGTKELIADTLFKLAQEYHSQHYFDTALRHFKEYLKKSESLKDNHRVGQACEAIGKTYVSLENLVEAQKYLSEFARISEITKDAVSFVRACIFAGKVLNKAGNYSMASDFFDRAFYLAITNKDNLKTTRNTRSLYGIAQGHLMLRKIIPYIVANRQATTEILFEWQEFRLNLFMQELPEKVSPVRREQRLVTQLRMEKEWVRKGISQETRNPAVKYAIKMPILRSSFSR